MYNVSISKRFQIWWALKLRDDNYVYNEVNDQTQLKIQIELYYVIRVYKTQNRF